MKDKKNTKISDFVSKVEDGTNEAFDRVTDSLMDEDAVEADGNFNYTDIVTNTKEEKMRKLPWIVAIVLILLIVLSFCALFFQSNPKTIFVRAIDGLFNGVTSKIGDNAYDIVNGNLDLEYVIHGGENSNLSDEISKIKWQADYSLDVTNNRAYANVTGDNGEGKLNFEVYNDKDDNYIKLDSVMDSYLKIGDGHFSLDGLNSFGDVSTLLEGINQAFDRAISSEKIIGGNKTIEVNGEKIKAYESKLVIDNNNKERFRDTFINSLTSNIDFIASLQRIRDADVLDLQMNRDNLEKLIDDMGNIEVSLYTRGDDHYLVKMDLTWDDGSFSLIKNNNENYDYDLKIDNRETSGNLKISSNDNKHNIELSVQEKEDGNVLVTQNIKLDLRTNNNGGFEDVDTSNFTEYANMSDVDKFNLQTNIVANPVVSKLVSAGLEINLDEWFK